MQLSSGKSNDVVEYSVIYLTEVNKKVEKKIEESQNKKYLKNKLEKLKLPNNFQLGIKSSFDNIFNIIKAKIDINGNKKISAEELINKKKKYLSINDNDNKEIKYKINKETIHILNNIKHDDNYIRNELSKIENNKKIFEIASADEDIIRRKANDSKLKKIYSKENELLDKLKLNKIKINSLIEENKTINKKQLIFKYLNNNSFQNLISKNLKTRNNKRLLLDCKQYKSLNEDQQKYNRKLNILNKESAKNQDKFEKDLEMSKQKKIKEIELKKQQIIILRKNYLQNLKNNEKEFFSIYFYGYIIAY